MIGIKVKQYLDENGIKYSFLSEKIGIPMNVLSPLLNGKRKMSVEEYFLICNALELPVDTFESRRGGVKNVGTKWYFEAQERNVKDLERRVKRLELICLEEARNKIASLRNSEAGTVVKDECLTIEEIINKKTNA